MKSSTDAPPLPLLRKSDQVFQLSLTELAFIVIFILLILFGWLVQHEQRRNAMLASDLKAAQDAVANAEAWKDIRDEVGSILNEAGVDKGAIDRRLSDLVERRTAAIEQQRLRRRVADLEGQLTALAALQANLESAADKAGAADKAVQEALAMRKVIENALGRAITPSETSKLAEQLAVAATVSQGGKGPGGGVKELIRSNERMKDLVAHYERRLNMRGGIDFPPCWLDSSTGKVEYLFQVDLIPSGVLLTPQWPSHRDTEARALPEVNALLNPKGLPLAEFNSLMQGIDQQSRAANCRHYVILDNHVGDLATFNRLRYGVENFFYKYEKR